MVERRAYVLWPRPRASRVQAFLADPTQREDMDGLSFLAEHGIQPVVLDGYEWPLNPFARKADLLAAAFDVLRFLKLIAHYRRFDILISIDSASCLLFVMMKRVFRLRKPVVVIDPGLSRDYPNRDRIHDKVLPYVERVIVFGKVQLQFLEKRYGGRVHATFVLHRIDTRFFDPAKAASAPPAAPFILTVGNDSFRDFQTLIEAARGLAVKTVLQTKLKFTGLPSNVEVNGERISYPALRDLYAQAAVVIVPLHPSIHAGGVNSLLEALSMGRPTIVSASEGILDYVEHGRTAWVVPPRDPVELRKAIELLLDRPDLREQLGSGARALSLEHYAMPVYAATIAGILDQISAKPRL